VPVGFWNSSRISDGSILYLELEASSTAQYAVASLDYASGSITWTVNGTPRAMITSAVLTVGVYPAVAAFQVGSSCRVSCVTITPPRYIPMAPGFKDGKRLVSLKAKASTALAQLPTGTNLNLLFMGMRGAGIFLLSLSLSLSLFFFFFFFFFLIFFFFFACVDSFILSLFLFLYYRKIVARQFGSDMFRSGSRGSDRDRLFASRH
jgi:hypothetical protein